MKLEDLTPLSKIKNKDGYELIIDKIIDDEIYTSGWNMPLNKFDRLRWTKEQVQSQINNLGWLLLDGKVRVTKDEFMKLVRNKFGSMYNIKEFIETKDKYDDNLIFEKKLKKGDTLYIHDGISFQFKGYIDNTTLLSLSTEGEEVNILVPDEELKYYSLNKPSGPEVSLEEASNEIYDLPANMILFTDEK